TPPRKGASETSAWSFRRANSRRRRRSMPTTRQRSISGGRSSGRPTSRRNEARRRHAERNGMKLPRRNFLHLAAGAAALPAVSRHAQQPSDRPMSHQVNRSTMARQSRANPVSRQESRRGNSSSNKQRSKNGYDDRNPSLRTGGRGLTVWTLQKMAQEKRFKELDDLFDNGLTMNALPVGRAAGTAARVFDIDIELINQCLDWFVSKLWRG